MLEKVINAMWLPGLIILVSGVDGGGFSPLQAMMGLAVITISTLWTMPKTGWYYEINATKKAPESAGTLNQSR